MTTSRTPDPGPDDETLAKLVREVADGWVLPPQRLGARTWRERVSAHQSRARWRRLRAPAAGWLRRAGTAASAAVVATVALALVAVWLTLPRTPAIGDRSSPGATNGGSPNAMQPSPAPTPTSTPLPAFALYGPRIEGRVIVETVGTYRIVDLATGTFAGDIVQGTSPPTRLHARPGGGFVCACIVSTSPNNSLSGEYVIDARVIGRDGKVVRRTPIVTLESNIERPITADASNGLSAISALSSDGTTLYVAWAYRTTPVWHLGVSVVDVDRGRVVQTVRLPDRQSTDGKEPTSIWFATLSVAPDDGHLMLRIDVFRGQTLTSAHVVVTLADGRIATTATLGDTTDINAHPCYAGTGWANAMTVYTVCPESAVFRSFRLDGSLVTEADLGPGAAVPEVVPGSSDVVDRATGRLFHWNPIKRVLTRIDLATGRVTGTATAAQARTGSPDPADGLAALGRSVGQWLAPAAVAKTILQPSIALSPDGTRIYALGMTTPERADPGSTGVDVFDAVAMRAIDHWAPPADLVSVAASPDGRYVYVAGAPEADASGERRIGAPASLIVFDASDGKVRLIAGSLGPELASFLP
jgi:hypothetical protein